MRTFKTVTVARLLAGIGLALATCAGAQTFPDKPLRLIVANSPGSTHDLLSRLIGTEMKKYVDQPIVIENKPGAGQMIGYEFVAK